MSNIGLVFETKTGLAKEKASKITYHVVINYDRNSNRNGMKIYVDGVISQQGTSSIIIGSLLNNDSVVVGALSAGANKFTGQIDDLMVLIKN